MMDWPNRSLQDEDRDVMVRYLLHTLPEPERTAVQDRLAAEEDFFAAMQETEYDLCDAFVRGQLPAEEAEALRRLAGRSEYWRERVEEARSFQRARQTRRTPWAAGIAAAVMMAVAGGWWLTSRPVRGPAPAPTAIQGAPAVAVFLTPGVLRGGAVVTVAAPEGTPLRLQLEASALPREGEPRVRVQSASGVVVEEVQRPTRRQEGAAEYLEVLVTIPGAGGSYEVLVLNGEVVAGRYLFRLER